MTSRCRRATWWRRACPIPAELGDRMHGVTCAGTWVDRHRHRRQSPRGLPAPRRRQRLVDGRVRLARPWCGRRRSTPSWPSSSWPRGRGPASVCSGPRPSPPTRSSTCSSSTAPLGPRGADPGAALTRRGSRLVGLGSAQGRAGSSGHGGGRRTGGSPKSRSRRACSRTSSDSSAALASRILVLRASAAGIGLGGGELLLEPLATA